MIKQLLDYNNFNKYCKMTAIDLSKQNVLDTDPIQQINFTGSLARDPNANKTIFFNYWRSQRNYFGFFTKNCKSIINSFALM